MKKILEAILYPLQMICEFIDGERDILYKPKKTMSKEFDEFMDGVKNIDLNKITCMFEPKTDTTSATICKHCGQEKFMHNQVPDVRKKVEDDVEKLAAEFYPLNDELYPNSTLIRKAFVAGYNKAKETLYTEEQVREAFNKGWHSGYDRCTFDSKNIQDSDMKNQSLKQPKQ